MPGTQPRNDAATKARPETERPAHRRQNERLALCHRCSEANAGGVCERVFPQGKCYTGWLAWLRAAESSCPLGKWPAAAEAASKAIRAAFDTALSDD